MEWVLGTLVVVLLGCGTALLLNLRKQKALLKSTQHQLSQSQQALEKSEQASDSKSRYLSGLSHELRTPLNVIMGHAQLLAQKDPENSAYQLIKQNGEHVNHLIESLLSHAAMEAGKIKLHHEIFDLHTLLEQLTHTFKPMAEEQDLSWHVNITPQLPRWVKSDQQRLKQILINLLSNAIKFTHTGGIKLNISYRSQVASFEVTDTGTGIKPEQMDAIFTPFERLNNPAPGTGLGLPIAQSLSTLLGGELTVKSQTGRGSTFILKLMLAPHNQPQSNTTKNKVSTGLDVLVVDDNIEHLDITAQFLAADQHQASTFTSADKALKHLHNHTADLCILDINMPEMNGWQLAQIIRDSGHTMPIIMLSGNPKDQVQSQHQNHQAYLNKPLTFEALRTCIQQWAPKPNVRLNASQQATLTRLAEINHSAGMEKHLQQWREQQTINQDSYQSLMNAIQTMNSTELKTLIRGAHE